MKDLDLPEFFLNEKPCSVLVEIRRLDEAYASVLSREVETTYAHCVSTISILKERGLVESEQSGRKKILSLTEDGEAVAEALENLEDVLESVGENQ